MTYRLVQTFSNVNIEYLLHLPLTFDMYTLSQFAFMPEGQYGWIAETLKHLSLLIMSPYGRIHQHYRNAVT